MVSLREDRASHDSPRRHPYFRLGPSPRVRIGPLGEFSHMTIPPEFFAPLIHPQSSVRQEARLHLKCIAFLHFAPAQYKLGHVHVTNLCSQSSRSTPSSASNITRSPVNKAKTWPTWRSTSSSCMEPRRRPAWARTLSLRLPKRLLGKDLGAPRVLQGSWGRWYQLVSRTGRWRGKMADPKPRPRYSLPVVGTRM